MTGKELIKFIEKNHLEDYTLNWCGDFSTDKGPHQQLRFLLSEKPTDFEGVFGEPLQKLKFAYVDVYENTGFCRVRTMLVSDRIYEQQHITLPRKNGKFNF